MSKKKLGTNDMSSHRGFRVGHRVRFNDAWEENVHLGGSPEGDSNIPGGTEGTVTSVKDNEWGAQIVTVATHLGEATAHHSYLVHVAKVKR